MNPCPCGFHGSHIRECTCTNQEVLRYQKRISGPILDRIDIKLYVPYLGNQKIIDKLCSNKKLIQPPSTPVSKNCIQFYTQSVVKNNITTAIKVQNSRCHSNHLFNGCLNSSQIKDYIHLSPPVKKHLELASEKLQLSARSLLKIVRLARTIADLDASSEIKIQHISEAISFNQP